MQLYEINASDRSPVHVIARDRQQAVDIFVTWSAARGEPAAAFDMDELPIENLRLEQQQQVRSAIAAGLVGIAHFDEENGWTFSPPMWVPLAPGEVSDTIDQEDASLMCIFEMRDLTPIEAFVLASDYERAAELFKRHLRANGGDPDALLYRELELQQLGESANDAVYEALDIGWEGLVICDDNGRWSFVTPLGSYHD